MGFIRIGGVGNYHIRGWDVLDLRKISFLYFILFAIVFDLVSSQPYDLTRIATGLENPRGIAMMPDGRLIVAQAGTGFIPEDSPGITGRLSVLEDLNMDGDFEDPGELSDVIENLPSYNLMYQSNPGRDEIIGIGDVIALEDGRIFFTLDDNFEVLSIVEVSPDFEIIGNLIERVGTMNSIAYDAQREIIYITESTLNGIGSVNLDGDYQLIVYFGPLDHRQQSVPSGLAIDPNTGDLLVALFSGQLWDYYGETLSFMPGDAKVVRVNPETGEYADEITGLTTAVDVAFDERGNLYVAEMTTEWPTPVIMRELDLYDPQSPPDPGGYARFTGRITMYPVDNGVPIVLANELDLPTNITYHDGNLYISVGQGTPGRAVWGDQGINHIVGEIYKIALPG